MDSEEIIQRCAGCGRTPDLVFSKGIWRVSCHGVTFANLEREGALKAWDRYEWDMKDYRISSGEAAK